MKYPEYKAIITNIRNAAQHLFDNGSEKTNSQPAEGHLSTLVDDLKTHQIELEKQVEGLHHSNGKPKESTDVNRELFELAGVALFLLSKQGKVVDVNPCGAGLLRTDRLKIIDRSFDTYLSDASVEIFNPFFQRFLDNSSKETCEIAFQSGSEEGIPVKITGSVAANGELCLITAIDISLFKKDQLDKSAGDLHLRETQKLARLGTYSVDFISGNWKSSSILDEIYGLEPDFEKSFKTWSTILHPDWQQVLNRYFLDNTLNEKTKFDKEYTIVRQNDKTVRWVHGIGHLKLDEKNNPVSLVGTIQDITERRVIEQALYESEAKYRELIQNSMVGVFKSKITEEVVFANDACLKMLGYDSLDDLIYSGAKAWYKFPQQRRELIEIMNRDGHVEAYEVSFLTKDGSEIIVLLSAVLFGETMNGTVVDITARRNAEKDLILANQKATESNLRFRSYIEYAPDGVFIADEEGNYLEVNPGATTITGYSEKELLTMSCKNFIPRHALHSAYKHFMTLLNTGFSKADIEFIHKSGEVRWWSVEGVKLSEKRILGFVKDITERKKAEQEIEKERRNNSALINSTKDLIWSVDSEYKLIAANTAFVQALQENIGRLVQEGENLLMSEHFSTEYLDFWKVLYDKGLAGDAVHTEVDSPSKDEPSPTVFDISINPIIYGDTISGVACWGRNFTKRKSNSGGQE